MRDLKSIAEPNNLIQICREKWIKCPSFCFDGVAQKLFSPNQKKGLAFFIVLYSSRANPYKSVLFVETFFPEQLKVFETILRKAGRFQRIQV